MALACIWFNNGSLKPIAPEKAVEIWQALNGITEPSETQAEFLTTIKDIFIPPSYRKQAEGYEAAHKLAPQRPDTSHIIHPGITQGMTQALPVNDRD